MAPPYLPHRPITWGSESPVTGQRELACPGDVRCAREGRAAPPFALRLGSGRVEAGLTGRVLKRERGAGRRLRVRPGVEWSDTYVGRLYGCVEGCAGLAGSGRRWEGAKAAQPLARVGCGSCACRVRRRLGGRARPYVRGGEGLCAPRVLPADV